MYRQARAGKLEHFTGVSDPYEAPLSARCAGGLDPEFPAKRFCLL